MKITKRELKKLIREATMFIDPAEGGESNREFINDLKKLGLDSFNPDVATSDQGKLLANLIQGLIAYANFSDLKITDVSYTEDGIGETIPFEDATTGSEYSLFSDNDEFRRELKKDFEATLNSFEELPTFGALTGRVDLDDEL